jgi:hypothetical protein
MATGQNPRNRRSGFHRCARQIEKSHLRPSDERRAETSNLAGDIVQEQRGVAQDYLNFRGPDWDAARIGAVAGPKSHAEPMEKTAREATRDDISWERYRAIQAICS